jgi:tetratricopeptide (TPR) repeat protein
MNKVFTIIISCFFLTLASAGAQTLITKEAMNSFAQYTSSKDIKKLEIARAKIDEAYKTKADSFDSRHNLIRALVYSTLAHVDSNLKYTYKKDPIDEVLLAMKHVYGSKVERENRDRISYIEKQLKETYLFRANTALKNRKPEEAFKYFTILDSIDKTNISVSHNLALLAQELGYYQKSVAYYEKLTQIRPRPEYFLVLANLYELINDETNIIRVLNAGADNFPTNRDIIFKLLNTLQNKGMYGEIIKHIDQAIKLDENNINLNYLAGFSHEMLGNISKAEEYYKSIIEINPNNFDSNYALGLLYLNLYLKDKKQNNIKYVSKTYLIKANEIDPNELKSLNSLAIFYKHSGETTELQKINNRINQLKLN